MDFKFTGTRDEENAKDVKDALCISLVMVDQESKFVHAIPVPSKEVTGYLVEEVCRVLMLMEKKVILRTDTEPAMLSLRNKVQLIRKMNNLETEIQDVSPDEHQGLQVERWVQTVRNLSKTLVYAAEKEANVKITSESTLYPWLARHACFLLNRFVVQGGRTPFEVLFDREYKGALAPLGSTVLARPLPQVKEKGEPWKKGIFVGKDHVSNANLISTSSGIIKARTMRRCTPVFDAETMFQAAGTPWNYAQQAIAGRKQKRRLPNRGIEALPPVPRSPSQQAASDATPTEGYQPSVGDDDDDGDDDGNDEDPGEGTKRKATGSASGGTASSEELVPDEEGVPSPTKRGTETRGSMEPSPTRIRVEEPPAVVEERPEKLPKVSKVRLPDPGFTDSEAEDMREKIAIRTVSDDESKSTSSTSDSFKARIRRVCSLKSVRDVEMFLKSEEIKYNDDEEVDIEEFNGLEADIVDDEEIEGIYGSEESPNEEIPEWSHEFEEGPPKLEDHELEAVDKQSRMTEIERLMDMKVLKPIGREQAESGSYKHLSTKIVYDWRHRDGQWKRRGRLVAREFRWLTDYDLAALFSPTGVASTVKLLSALFTSTDGYILGSVDVSDAYLQVEQAEPTVVEIDGEYYELGYTLPGQRTGSSAWFNKLQGIVEKYGLKSDEGLPAIFYKLPKDGEPGMIILSHVDDLEIFATKHGFDDLVKKLESEGLKLKVEGPLEQGKGSIGFLKRTFTATFEGVDISMNAKYVESLEDVLELDKAFPKKLPVPADGGRAIHMKKGAQNPLTPEDHHLYRKGVGILLYLAPERPDLMFALKKLSMKLANPTEGDLELLRFVGKYLKGCPDIRLLHTTSYPGRSFQEKRNRSHEQVRKRDIYSQKSLIEICSDSDWAADRETRQSVSCGAIFVNGNMIHFQSKRQRSISLSSCESETIAAVSIMSEGIFIQKLIGRLTGIEPEVRLYIDSSSSRQFISRKGLGKARHLDVNILWIQKMKNVLVKAIKGTENPADLGTKALSKDKIKKYMKALGYRGEFIEEDEMQTRKVTKMKSISVGMIAKIVAVLMSEGFSVEATRIGEVFVESKPWCMSGLYWLILICLGMFICVSMTMTCSSAAVLVQAVGPGKGKEAEASKEKEGKEKKEEKGSMMGDEKKSEDQSRPSPEEQAEQLRAMALESKRNRIQAVIAAGGKPAEEEPADEMDVESEKDEREEKEKEEKEKEEAPKEADDSESSSSSSSTDEEEPTNAQVDKKETVEATDAPEDKKEAIEATDAPEDKKEAVEATDAPEDKEEAIDEEQVRNEAIRRFDERFINALKPHGQKASDFTHCASRTVGGMVHSLMSVFLEPSECEEETLRALQALGELNLETITNLREGLERSQEFKRCLEEKLIALKKEKDDYDEQMYEKKVGWIKTRLSELGAEARVSDKGLKCHEGVDDFCTEVFKLLRAGQDDPDAKVFGWKIRSHEGLKS